MATLAVEDGRKYARVRSRILVRLCSGAGRGDTALARDIARGGLGIEFTFARRDECVEVMSWCGRIKIEVDLPAGQTAPISAEMVWLYVDVTGEADRYLGGLRFLEMYPWDKKRLDGYVSAKIRQQSPRHRLRQRGDSNDDRRLQRPR
jgi:hypothetical protein